ncbi:MAG: hypothetical protein HY057_04645, partial [Rhodospirillales bacterium]|nr:hypothetical protein [Rhodospirillales bacterium]
MQRIIGFLPLRGLAIAAGAAIWLFSVGAYAQQPAPPGDGAMHGRGMGPGMIAPGLMIPNMNAQRGRRLFAE